MKRLLIRLIYSITCLSFGKKSETLSLLKKGDNNNNNKMRLNNPDKDKLKKKSS